MTVEYKEEDLPQVNPQLYEWLATVNGKSSTNSVPDSAEKVNTTDEKNQFSRETEDVNQKKDTKVTMTRGAAQKQKAKYKSDKVYSQNGVR